MTVERSKALELRDERSAHKQYRKVLREEANRPVRFSGSANLLWTGDGVPKRKKAANGDLLGRVALIRPDEDLLDGGTDFYIGEAFAKVNGTYVYGWSNPVACTFFRGSEHHYLCDEVAVVRSFSLRNDQIDSFVDEVIHDDAPKAPFTKRGLTVPAAPSAPKLPVPSPPAAPPVSEPASAPADPEPAQGARQGAEPAERDQGDRTVDPPPASQSEGLVGLRAGELLLEQLAAPRTKSLAPVLATLQPDQYNLVTWPAMDSLIVEGQPGTGKTIVASHRAAYLVNDETPPENTLDGTILVVGPTVGYSRHVQGVISRLAGTTDRIKVMSLPELINHVIGVEQPPRALYSRTWRDVDRQLAKFARSALSKIKSATGATPSAEEIYQYLRTKAGSLKADQGWRGYLRTLPDYKTAISDGIHSALVAFLNWEVSRPTDLSRVEHVIVDEAQDVTPLEWLLLREINEADAWTILGDLHQRRSDHSLSSWAQTLEVIAIDPETPVRRMMRGYRSTGPILEYANRLLPRKDRNSHALQADGPAPSVRKVHPKTLAVNVISETERLIDTYPDGTVAVICAAPALIVRGLRAQGWVNSQHHSHVWQYNGREVTVIVLDEARGLEFDAVVVVEPADFPKNVGRHGPLYTALTRANRELSVLYTRGLPDQLRRRPGRR